MQWIVWATMATLLGCQPEFECDEDRPCEFGATCMEGVCETKSCVTSADCSMESHCDNGACTEGCAEDSDCYAGDACNAEFGTCDEAECEDSQLDCGFKEFCDTTSGECHEAAYYCDACTSNDDCGTDGICNSYGPYGNFCVFPCTTRLDCPSGFSCEQAQNADGTVGSFCSAACWLEDDAATGGPPAP